MFECGFWVDFGFGGVSNVWIFDAKRFVPDLGKKRVGC